MKSSKTAEEVLKTIGLVLLILCTFVANTFVLVVLLVNERRRLLKKPLYLFIANICVSDILACAFTMTFEASEEVTHSWLFGEAVCKMVAFLEMSLFGVSIFTHFSIAVERYMSVVHPLKPPMKLRIAKKMLLVAWCFPSVMALPYLYKHRLEKVVTDGDGHMGTVCLSTSIPIFWLEKLYASLELLLVFLLPLLAIIVMYAVIVRKLVRRKFQINDIAATHRLSRRAATYGSRVSIAVVTVFVGCWMPFIAMYVIRVVTSAEDVGRLSPLFVTALYSSFFSELVSPIMYCAFDRNIRPALLRVLCRRRCGSDRRRVGVHRHSAGRGDTSRNETNENRTENPASPQPHAASVATTSRQTSTRNTVTQKPD